MGILSTPLEDLVPIDSGVGITPRPINYLRDSPLTPELDSVGSVTGNAAQASQNISGVYGKGAFEDFFNGLRFTPDSFVFRGLGGDTIVSGVLWNAYHLPDLINELVYSSNLMGITVTLDQPLPHNLLQYSTLPFTATILSEGVESFELVITVGHTNPQTATLTFSGNRLIVFPYSPEGNFSQRLEFMTSLGAAYSGETRTRRRKKPRRRITYRAIANYSELNYLINTARKWGFRKWAVPLWNEGEEIQVVELQNTIPFDTTDKPYFPGGTVIFWVSPSQYHVTQITMVDPTGIMVLDPLPWGAKVYLAPIVKGRVSTGVGTNQISNSEWIELEATFEEDAANLVTLEAGTNPTFPFYSGSPLVKDPFHVEGKQAERLIQPFTKFDNSFNDPHYIKTQESVQYQGSFTFVSNTMDEYRQVMKFIQYTGGRHKSFWVPEVKDSYVLYQDITSLDTQIVISYDEFIHNAQPSDLHFILKYNGQHQAFGVTNLQLTGATLTLTPTSAAEFSVPVGGEYTLHRLIKVRFNSDTINLQHEGKLKAKISAPIVEPSGG